MTDQMTPVLDPLTVPTFEECHAEAIRFYEDWKAGRISMGGIPAEHYVAYYDGRIVDHDPDMLVLQARAAQALNVHPDRVSVHYPWAW